LEDHAGPLYPGQGITARSLDERARAGMQPGRNQGHHARRLHPVDGDWPDVIIIFDRPRRSFIRISQQPMIDLQRQLQPDK
jgi:hypothetical protein